MPTADRHGFLFRLRDTVTFLLLFAIPAIVTADVPRLDVSGTWDVTVVSPAGTAHPVIILKQDGERISGTYKGRMGEGPLSGTIRENNIRFAVNLKFQDVSYRVEYTGTVAANSMKGTARFGDEGGSGSWTARKKDDGPSR